jgi:hypothetical protein
MKSFIHNLSARAELCLIMFIGFGLLIADSLWMVAKSGDVEISNAGCVVSAVSEASIPGQGQDFGGATVERKMT